MSERRLPLLERLGLHRPELRAWAMYDWANSAFVLVVITAVFPIYYKNVAAAGAGLDDATATKYLTYTTSVALFFVAALSPILGALADYLGAKKRMLATSVLVGSAATGGLFFVGSGDWKPALLLFAIGNACLFLSFVFYDSLLPHLVRNDKELDRLSTAGFAVGYFGSALLLIVVLAAVQNPAWFFLEDTNSATRWGFLAVALWWAFFTLPLLRKVPEPKTLHEADETDAKSAIKVTFQRLGETFRELRGNYRQAFLMLVAYMIYNEGIGTIIRMGGIYASSKNFADHVVIFGILMVQIVGIPFAFLFGMLGPKIGPKRAIMIGLAAYMVISVVAYSMKTETEFYIMAFLIALVQGGTQGLSRSLFGTLIPKHKASEFFGFFSVFAKVAGVLGPLVFGLVIAYTKEIQQAILSVTIFFIVGGLLLSRVNVAQGQKMAREIEQQLVS